VVPGSGVRVPSFGLLTSSFGFWDLVVHPLPDDFERRLGAILLLGRHVEVVDHHQHLLADWRAWFHPETHLIVNNLY